MHGAAEADEAHHRELTAALVDPNADLIAIERDKIKGAVRTDFVLSAEIIAITLGTVAEAAFATRVAVLVGVALLMTVGVYGFVAGIVKLDDAGLALVRTPGEGGLAAARRRAGAALLRFAPWLMKFLSVAGTAAMFLVGGSILLHGIAPLRHAIEAAVAGWNGVAAWFATTLADGATGVVAGAIVLAAVTLARRVQRLARATSRSS
jgi:predicted DNA repair protein MutK